MVLATAQTFRRRAISVIMLVGMASQFSQDIDVENPMTSPVSASGFTMPVIVTSSLSGRSFADSFRMNSDGSIGVHGNTLPLGWWPAPSRSLTLSTLTSRQE